MVQADLSTNLVLSSCCSVSACSHFAVRLATVLAARLDVEEWIFVTLDPATLRTKTFSRSGLGRSSIVVGQPGDDGTVIGLSNPPSGWSGLSDVDFLPVYTA